MMCIKDPCMVSTQECSARVQALPDIAGGDGCYVIFVSFTQALST